MSLEGDGIELWMRGAQTCEEGEQLTKGRMILMPAEIEMKSRHERVHAVEGWNLVGQISKCLEPSRG